jgi:hypothetical protein
VDAVADLEVDVPRRRVEVEALVGSELGRDGGKDAAPGDVVHREDSFVRAP